MTEEIRVTGGCPAQPPLTSPNSPTTTTGTATRSSRNKAKHTQILPSNAPEAGGHSLILIGRRPRHPATAAPGSPGSYLSGRIRGQGAEHIHSHQPRESNRKQDEPGLRAAWPEKRGLRLPREDHTSPGRPHMRPAGVSAAGSPSAGTRGRPGRTTEGLPCAPLARGVEYRVQGRRVVERTGGGRREGRAVPL